ncbi:unnamed protein product [Lupinus luteus]|uniref:Uncharacterized protein n=1 Tax=Lupinus luteus TaxID=3873 RepID=A0AAV1X0Z9_LUPLU
MSNLLKVIAAAVASDPEKFSEAFLGKSNAEYCNWILDPENPSYRRLWGLVRRLDSLYPDSNPEDIIVGHFFIRAFTGASGDALTFSPHSLSFKVTSSSRSMLSSYELTRLVAE